MRRWALVGTLFLVGCPSADPNAWRLYAKAAYTYGRIEAKAESHCAPPLKADRVEVCKEAGRVQGEIKTLAPTIEAELAKNKPDWPRIMMYLDLVLGLAAKAAL